MGIILAKKTEEQQVGSLEFMQILCQSLNQKKKVGSEAVTKLRKDLLIRYAWGTISE